MGFRPVVLMFLHLSKRSFASLLMTGREISVNAIDPDDYLKHKRVKVGGISQHAILDDIHELRTTVRVGKRTFDAKMVVNAKGDIAFGRIEYEEYPSDGMAE